MKFDFVAFLGGLTVGAATAAIYQGIRSKNLLGQGVVSGGGFGGGSYAPGGFGGPGVVAGPRGGGGGALMGPTVIDMAPADRGYEKTLVCGRRYPVKPVALGPLAGWL